MRCKRIWRMLYILPSALETQIRVYSERLPRSLTNLFQTLCLMQFCIVLQVSALEQTTMATTTTTSSTTTTTSKRYLSNFLTAEAESTLSNVTSIHTQLQSQSQSQSQSQLYETLNSMDKHSALLQELHQRQLQTVQRSATTALTVTDAAVSGGAAAAAATSGTKTATILVSKSKTKTGLPLLLKNSINN